jgi:hypothetical protein
MKRPLGCIFLVLLNCHLMVGQQYNFRVLYSFGAQAGDGIETGYNLRVQWR